MKPLAILITTFLLSFSVFADYQSQSTCIEKLTDGHERDSYTFTVDLDQSGARDYGKDKLATAISLVRSLLVDVGCSRKDVNFGKGPLGRSYNRCRMISPGRTNSIVCYIETNLGFFVVSHNYQTEYHITYNRWD